MRCCTLASGSAANATFISDGHTRILVDSGLSLRDLAARLLSIGERIDQIDSLVCSHEHLDHSAGLPGIARRHLPINLYMTEATDAAIDWRGYRSGRVEHFTVGEEFQVGSIMCRAFPVPHDAAEPCGFRFLVDGVRVAIATDLGSLPPEVRAELQSANVLLLESNYDADMLRVGPHSRTLQKRIESSIGHLDNAEAMDFLANDLSADCAAVILGHLSTSCNNRAVVANAAIDALAIRVNGRLSAPSLQVAQQDRAGAVVQL